MPQDNLRFVSLVASLAELSVIQAIANTLDELAPDDVEVGSSPDAGCLPVFDPELPEQRLPPEITAMTSSILKADAVVIVMPDVAETDSSALEHALAWLGGVPSRPLAGKSAAIQTASIGPTAKSQAGEQLRRILQSLGAIVLDEPNLHVADAHRKVDTEAGCVRDAETRRLIGSQLAALARLVRRRRAQGSGSA